MSFVKLMVVQELDPLQDDRLEIACGLAHKFGSELVGISAVDLLDSFSCDKVIAPGMFVEHRAKVEVRARVAEETFKSGLRSWQIEGGWRISLAHRPEEFVVAEARSVDLVITGLARASAMNPADLIMSVGRPVLIVPPEAEKLCFKTVIVAWKETRESRRAVADALPLLRAYETVHIIEIAAKDELEKAKEHVDDVADWLERHGIAPISSVLEASGDTSIQLAERAFIEGADLIVAGAYGHSRVREWVLGGVTRDLLTRIPCCSLLSR